MASWEQLRQHIYNNYNVSNDDGRLIQLGFNLGNGRSQLVYVQHQTLMDGNESWVHVESPFGTIDRVDVGQAVREVEHMVCGALACVGQFLTLRHAVPLANLDVNEFERPLALITTSADALESRLSIGDVH